MKNITQFDSEDFLNYIISKVERVENDRQNYQHTHDRVHYNPETGRLNFEEVCINQDGGCFGRGVFGEATIPTEWNSLLPWQLTNSPNWMDI